MFLLAEFLFSYKIKHSHIVLQETAKIARAERAQMQARAKGAAEAAAAAEARLAGQAMTGRGYMERIALLKAQLRDLQQCLDAHVSPVLCSSPLCS